MPYGQNSRLSAERANKLGHLEVVQSELVQKLVDDFETSDYNESSLPKVDWNLLEQDDDILNIIFCVDGSLQVIDSKSIPKKQLSFVKVALLTLDQHALGKLDPDYPHPFRLKQILEKSAVFHSTVFPLKNINLPDMSIYDTVRKIIFESFTDASLDGEPLKTLKWLAYEKWENDDTKKSLSFECPHCEKEINGMPYDSEISNCAHCKREIYITDMIGFHLDMEENGIPGTVMTSYMLVYETILLFTAIKFFWDAKKFNTLKDSLFLKDGPLTLNSQYSKLVKPIRNFLIHAKSNDVPIYIAGQEKTGRFVEYLELLSRKSPSQLSYFIPSNEFIDQEIRERPNRKDPYGFRVNYGNKIFVCNDAYHHIVLSIPTGEYKDTSDIDAFIGAEKIIKTINKLVSHKHADALIPIQLANGIASLSTYPSAQVLKLFASKVID